jgi:uncharacterized protein YoxC
VSGSDVAVVVASVAALLAAVALTLVTVWLVACVREVRRSLAHLRTETEAVVDDLRRVVAQAGDDLERADSVLTTLESVSDRVDAASELAVETFSKPVIKAVSLGSGTARAARRLRRRA